MVKIMNKYYISLTGQLFGYCLEVTAPNEEAVRRYAAYKLGRLWCSVYTEPKRMTVIGRIEELSEYDYVD